MTIIKQIIIITTVCIYSSCTLDNNEIRQRVWKCGKGSSLGYNFFVFGGSGFKLHNDTIFFLDTAIAAVIDTRKKWFLYDNEITLKKLKTKKTAIYNDFGRVKAEDTIMMIEKKQIDLKAPPIPPDLPPLAKEK